MPKNGAQGENAMTTAASKPKRSVLRWPIKALWKLVTVISNRIGILASLAIGLIAVFFGFVLTGTIVGAIIGIPLAIFGVFLFIRGII